MEIREILGFIEDKDVIQSDNWYFHATRTDIITIKKILEEGIKSAYLRNEKGSHFNGKYYISLYKNIEVADGLKKWLKEHPKFIIQDISPFYADRSKFRMRKLFINTRIPLRTSEWDGEYQQYLKVDPFRIVGIEYSLSHILADSDDATAREKLLFLRDMVLCLQQINRDLPIYDLHSNREFNKEKVLSLNF